MFEYQYDRDKKSVSDNDPAPRVDAALDTLIATISRPLEDAEFALLRDYILDTSKLTAFVGSIAFAEKGEGGKRMVEPTWVASALRYKDIIYGKSK